MLDSFFQGRPARSGVAIASGASLALIAGCGQGKLETCKFIEIEDAEVEVDVGDIDIERAEVEMVCDGKILDVTWPEFRRKLNIDPGSFQGSAEALEQVVTCGIYERANDDRVWCSTASTDKPVALKFSLDD